VDSPQKTTLNQPMVAPRTLAVADQQMDVKITTEKTSPSKGDEIVAKSIKDAFVADKALAPMASTVTVKVDKGIVTLNGSADSEKTKSNFENKAKSVAGVDRVVNNIVVKTK
jgi:osmotically-inducible protein OsmY